MAHFVIKFLVAYGLYHVVWDFGWLIWHCVLRKDYSLTIRLTPVDTAQS